MGAIASVQPGPSRSQKATHMSRGRGGVDSGRMEHNTRSGKAVTSVKPLRSRRPYSLTEGPGSFP